MTWSATAALVSLCSAAHADVALACAGARHFFYNAGDATADLHVRITLRPALRSRAFFESLAGLSHAYGRVTSVPPLQLILLFEEGDVQLALPAPVQLALRHVVAPLARLHGYKGAYDVYRTGVV